MCSVHVAPWQKETPELSSQLNGVRPDGLNLATAQECEPPSRTENADPVCSDSNKVTMVDGIFAAIGGHDREWPKFRLVAQMQDRFDVVIGAH
jgi:hypothetical protein